MSGLLPPRLAALIASIGNRISGFCASTSVVFEGSGVTTSGIGASLIPEVRGGVGRAGRGEGASDFFFDDKTGTFSGTLPVGAM